MHSSDVTFLFTDDSGIDRSKRIKYIKSITSVFCPTIHIYFTWKGHHKKLFDEIKGIEPVNPLKIWSWTSHVPKVVKRNRNKISTRRPADTPRTNPCPCTTEHRMSGKPDADLNVCGKLFALNIIVNVRCRFHSPNTSLLRYLFIYVDVFTVDASIVTLRQPQLTSAVYTPNSFAFVRL